MKAKEWLKQKGIHSTEPIYWDTGEKNIYLDELMDEFVSNQVQAVVMVNFADLADEVKQDIENRIVKGVQTYGERLKINNGRNALLDAYEEILDLALYIKQELKEKESKISA